MMALPRRIALGVAAPLAAATSATAAGADASSRFHFSSAPPAWLIILILVPALALVVWASYRATRLENPRTRIFLALLRFSALGLLLVILFGPQIEKRFFTREKRALAIAIDTSLSMGVRDTYPQKSPRVSLEQALRAAGAEESPGDLSRLQIAKRLIGGNALAKLAQEYRIFLLPFAGSCSTIALPAPKDTPAGAAWKKRVETALAELEPHGRSTDLALAIERALNTWSGEDLRDLFVLSDEHHNAASEPLPAALEAAAEGVRIFPVLIGDPSPLRNVKLTFRRPPPRVVLAGDQVTVELEARAQGYEPASAPREVPLNLAATFLGKRSSRARPIEEQGLIALEPIAQEQPERRSREWRGSTSIVFSAQREGIYRIDVDAALQPEEQRAEDNRASTLLIVRDSRVRVLYIEGYPRWEYRDVADLLLRADEKIVAQIWLASATNTQKATIFRPRQGSRSARKLAPLKELPLDLDQLVDWCPKCLDIRPFERLAPSSPERKLGRCSIHGEDLEPRYHVVILGDLSPGEIGSGNADSKRLLKGLKRFVIDGGGLLLISGEQAMPYLYEGNTDFESLLPVHLLDGPQRHSPLQNEYYRPILELSQDRRPHPICRLLPDPKMNGDLWENPQKGLPPLLWFCRVGDLRLGAEAILRHPTSIRVGAEHDASNRRNLDVLAAVREVGRNDGRIAWLGFDSTWRWHMPYGRVHQDRFYRNAIRWLALPRLLHPSRALKLSTDEPEYHLGDLVQVTLELEPDCRDFPSRPEQIEAWLQPLPPPAETWANTLTLVREAAPAGEGGQEVRQRYTATLPATRIDAAGPWRVFLAGGDRNARKPPRAFADFDVVADRVEVEQTHPDASLAAAIAQRSGGKLLLPGEFRDQLARLEGEGTISRETGQETPQPLWDNLGALLLVFFLLCMEWILRKRAQLI